MYALTLGAVSIADAPLIDIVNAAGAAGFAGCGLRVTGRKADEPGFTLVGDKAGVAELKRLMSETGLRPSNIVAYQFAPSLQVEDLKPVVEIAAQLGGKMMSAVCQDPEESRFVDKLGRYAALAKEIGARVNIEFIPYSEARTIAQAARMAAAAGDNVGVKVDALHLMRSGGTPADIKKTDAKFFMGQLCDAPRDKAANIDLSTESRTSRLYPGEGGLPLYDFLDALPRQLSELELGIPHAADKNLPVAERAKRMFAATHKFLATYLNQRKA